MGRGQFEDILEDCLSALLEGRRSIEESLSLYPAWRGRLEPLLKAAEEIAAGLDQVPPLYVRERGLQRFLEAARTRRRLREILPPQETAVPWWRWASTGLAAVIVIGALAFTSAILMAEDGRSLSEHVSVRLYTPVPQPTAAPVARQTSLERVQERVAVLEESVRQGEPVEVELLAALEEASNDLAADLDGPQEMGLVERVAAVSVTSQQYDLLQELRDKSSGVQEQAVEASLAAAEDVLEKLGTTPEPEPEPEASPSPSPEPTASPEATPSPEPSSTPGVEESPIPPLTPTPAQ